MDDLRESSSWKSEPFSLSWDSYSTPFSEDDHREQRFSKNRRNISRENNLLAREMFLLAPGQTLELATFLDSHSDRIREMADEDSMNVKKLLGRAYRLILSWPRANEESGKLSKTDLK